MPHARRVQGGSAGNRPRAQHPAPPRCSTASRPAPLLKRCRRWDAMLGTCYRELIVWHSNTLNFYSNNVVAEPGEQRTRRTKWLIVCAR